MAGFLRGLFLVSVFVAPSAFAGERVSPNEAVSRLHAMSLERIGWAELAADRAQEDAILRFAEGLVQLDEELDRALVEYARENGIALPEPPRRDGDGPLGRLDGAAFETAFLARVAQSNAAGIAFTERAREQFGNPALKRLLNKALATYRESQRELEKVYEELPAG